MIYLLPSSHRGTCTSLLFRSHPSGSLRVRDTMSIIEITNDSQNSALRGVIAANDKWTNLKLRRWPAFSLSEKQVEAVQDRLYFSRSFFAYNGDPVDIVMWYHQPTTSKGLKLPEYRLLRRDGDCEYNVDNEEAQENWEYG